MPVSALSAARSLCQMRDWSLSNLELQKILYIAHMLHLGEHGKPLVAENFEAWDYGPVVPKLYRRVKGFGSEPIRNVFHWVPEIDSSSTEFAALKDAVEQTRSMSPGQLVSITHWPKGAWYEVYKPNHKGIVIPNDLIADEYRKWQRQPSR